MIIGTIIGSILFWDKYDDIQLYGYRGKTSF